MTQAPRQIGFAEGCPFVTGDVVVYRPSEEGPGRIVMIDMARLVPGHKYRIVRVDRGIYVVPEDFENSSGGGLHWQSFRRTDSADDQRTSAGSPQALVLRFARQKTKPILNLPFISL